MDYPNISIDVVIVRKLNCPLQPCIRSCVLIYASFFRSWMADVTAIVI